MVITRRNVAGRIAWTLVVVCAFCIAFAGSAFAQRRAVAPSAVALQGNSTVRVMTRNMDAGTDLKYVLAGGDFETALKWTIGEVIYGDPEARAKRLAEEIKATKPDLVALQEATLWEFPGGGFDQLALLMQALKDTGLHYEVAAVQTLTDIPIDLEEFHALFRDRNAILMRSDLPPGQLELMGTETHIFEAKAPIDLPIGTVYEVEGWMAADVKVRGARVKFANTHLRSPIPGDLWADTVKLQMWQASELVAELGESPLPVILAGDFNSDASGVGTPDTTLSAGIVMTAGFREAWPLLHPNDVGFTWGVYLEDQVPPTPPIVPANPTERIDLIFSLGPVPTAVMQVGTTPGAGGVYASDHIGVVADFSLEVGMRAVARK